MNEQAPFQGQSSADAAHHDACLEGEVWRTTDGSARLLLLPEWRARLGPRPRLAVMDGVLCIYPPDEWETAKRTLLALQPASTEARIAARLFFLFRHPIKVDKRGRVLLPQHARHRFGLTDEVVLVGAGDRVEVWPAGVWQEVSAELIAQAGGMRTKHVD